MMYGPDDDDDDPCYAVSLGKSSVDLAYSLLNDARRAQGLARLRRSVDLEAKATTHALTTAHLREQVHSTASALQLQFLVNSPHAAENLLCGDSVESMLEIVQKQQQEASSGETKRMGTLPAKGMTQRSPFTQVGIGIAQSTRDNKFYMVQLFCGELNRNGTLILGMDKRRVLGAFVLFWVLIMGVTVSQWSVVSNALWPQTHHHRKTYCRSRLSKALPHRCNPTAQSR